MTSPEGGAARDADREAWRRALCEPDGSALRRHAHWLAGVGIVVLATALPISIALMNIGFALLLLWLMLAPPPRLGRHPALWCWLAFVGWCALSWSLSPDERPIKRFGMYYTPLAFFAAVAAFALPWARRWALRMLLTAGCLAAFLALLQFLLGWDEHSKPFRLALDGQRFVRTSGFFHWHMIFAMVLLLIGVLAAQDRRALGVPAWLAWPARLLAPLGVLLSSSRGAVLALAAGLWSQFAARGWRWALLGLLAGIVLAGVGLLAMRSYQAERFEKLMAGKDVRWEIWAAAADMVAERPLLGLGGRKAYERQYLEVAEQPGGPHKVGKQHAHNIELSIAAEHGIPAAVLYFAMLGAMAWPLWRRRRERPIGWRLGAGALTVFLVNGQFDHFAGDSEANYALYLLLALAYWIDEPEAAVAS